MDSTDLNYVWSKALSNTQSTRVGDNTAPLDYYNLALEKSVASYDRAHFVKGYFTYDLLFGRKGSLWRSAPRPVSAVIAGWTVSGTINASTGVPLNFPASRPYSYWNGGTNRADIAPGPYIVSGFDGSKFNLMAPSSSANTYLDKSKFSNPAPMTLGTSARYMSMVRGLGRWSEDLCLHKSHTLAEKYRLQLRAEFLNPFYRHWLGNPTTTVTSPTFGQITSVSGSRSIQAGFRVDF